MNRRGCFGYQNANQNKNDIRKVPYMRQPSNVMVLSRYGDSSEVRGEMDGEGIMDIARTILKAGKTAGKFLWRNKENIAKGAKIAKTAYTSEAGAALRNSLPSSDDTARDGFAGEQHALLKLKNGKTGVANYMGPQTNLTARLKRGDPGRTAVDKISKAHDIRYALAKNVGDVRKADNIMINAVKTVERNRGDAPRNIRLAKLITLKKYGEDLGLIRKDAFSGDLANKIISADESRMLMSKLGGLAQKGYGLSPAGGGLSPAGGAMLPGDALKQKLIKQMLRGKKSTKTSRSRSIMTGPRGSGAMPTHKSKSKTLPGMSNYKMIGSGSGVIGKPKIMNFVSNNLMPLLMKSVGIPKGTVSLKNIGNIISKSLDMAKSGNLQGIISNLTKTILPLLTAAKLQAMNVPMRGKGLMTVLGKAKKGLQSQLGQLLFGAFKGFINHHSPIPVFAGSGMMGKGFWSSFAKGFTSVFKPFATIAGPILDAVGLPEFGIPLSAIGGIL
jgi:hypothetical protein